MVDLEKVRDALGRDEWIKQGFNQVSELLVVFKQAISLSALCSAPFREHICMGGVVPVLPAVSFELS
jgi:hypothetical protein